MQTKPDLTIHWIITGMMVFMLVSYNIICHFFAVDLAINITADQRELVRTILYVAAITLFPLCNLLRHILLRLNQTMPGDNPAKNRYLMTTIVTLSIIEVVALFGFIMFLLGDGYNTLYIFSALGALGIYLHRPREEEYKKIIEALRIQKL